MSQDADVERAKEYAKQGGMIHLQSWSEICGLFDRLARRVEEAEKRVLCSCPAERSDHSNHLEGCPFIRVEDPYGKIAALQSAVDQMVDGYTYENVARERDTLKSRLSQLEAVCAEAYQMAGAYEAPVKALDNLAAAAGGHPIPHESFLPMENQWEGLLSTAEKSLERIAESGLCIPSESGDIAEPFKTEAREALTKIREPRS